MDFWFSIEVLSLSISKSTDILQYPAILNISFLP